MARFCTVILRCSSADRSIAQEANVYPFLQCTGTIQSPQFNTWLGQDYLFVVDFTWMVRQVLASAPPHHFDVILGGLSAPKDVNWFKERATEQQLDLNTQKQPTCTQYCNYMYSIATMPYVAPRIPVTLHPPAGSVEALNWNK